MSYPQSAFTHNPGLILCCIWILEVFWTKLIYIILIEKMKMGEEKESENTFERAHRRY